MYLFVGILLIVFFLFFATIDLLFIPTSILTIISLLGFLCYLGYVFLNINQLYSIYLFLFFIVTTSIYLLIIFKFKLWKFTSLRTKLNNNNNYIDKIDKLINKSGFVISSLRPGGKVEIDGEKYDAITKSGYINTGNGIIVVGRLGSQIEVIIKQNKTN